jgi:hypothetical protein
MVLNNSTKYDTTRMRVLANMVWRAMKKDYTPAQVKKIGLQGTVNIKPARRNRAVGHYSIHLPAHESEFGFIEAVAALIRKRAGKNDCWTGKDPDLGVLSIPLITADDAKKKRAKKNGKAKPKMPLQVKRHEAAKKAFARATESVADLNKKLRRAETHMKKTKQKLDYYEKKHEERLHGDPTKLSNDGFAERMRKKREAASQADPDAPTTG